MADFDPDLTVKPAQRKDGSWYAEVQDWIIHKASSYFRQRGRPSANASD